MGRRRQQLVPELDAALPSFQIDALLLVAVDVAMHALENTARAHIREELHLEDALEIAAGIFQRIRVTEAGGLRLESSELAHTGNEDLRHDRKGHNC